MLRRAMAMIGSVDATLINLFIALIIVSMVRAMGGWQCNIYAEAGNNDNIYQR